MRGKGTYPAAAHAYAIAYTLCDSGISTISWISVGQIRGGRDWISVAMHKVGLCPPIGSHRIVSCR